jgi:hypothetical protein
MNSVSVPVALESGTAGSFRDAWVLVALQTRPPGRDEDVEQGLAALGSRRVGNALDDRKRGIFRKSRIAG